MVLGAPLRASHCVAGREKFIPEKKTDPTEQIFSTPDSERVNPEIKYFVERFPGRVRGSFFPPDRQVTIPPSSVRCLHFLSPGESRDREIQTQKLALNFTKKSLFLSKIG